MSEPNKDIESIWRILVGDKTKPHKIGLYRRVEIIEDEHKKIKKFVSRCFWIVISLVILSNTPAFLEWLAKILTTKPVP